MKHSNIFIYVSDGNIFILQRVFFILANNLVKTIAGTATAGVADGSGIGSTFNAPYVIFLIYLIHVMMLSFYELAIMHCTFLFIGYSGKCQWIDLYC